MWAKIKNILWLNIKKFRVHAGWKILLISMNFMLFFSATLTETDGTFISQGLYLFIFILVSLANLLFLAAKSQGEQRVISLLRSMGASRLFIVIDYSTENFLQLFISFVCFSVFLFFRTVHWPYLLISLSQLFLVFFSSMILSLIQIHSTEKILRMK